MVASPTRGHEGAVSGRTGDSFAKTSHARRTKLAEVLAINKTRLNAWLKQAVDDGELDKLTKPVRYEAVSRTQHALALE